MLLENQKTTSKEQKIILNLTLSPNAENVHIQQRKG